MRNTPVRIRQDRSSGCLCTVRESRPRQHRGIEVNSERTPCNFFGVRSSLYKMVFERPLAVVSKVIHGHDFVDAVCSAIRVGLMHADCEPSVSDQQCCWPNEISEGVREVYGIAD